ncbi:hypothetical protein ACU686_10330 [Yinghuangia aomiensis]
MRMTEPAARARAYDLMGLALNALGVRDDSAMRSVGGPCVEDADVNKQRHGYVSVGYGLGCSTPASPRPPRPRTRSSRRGWTLGTLPPRGGRAEPRPRPSPRCSPAVHRMAT